MKNLRRSSFNFCEEFLPQKVVSMPVQLNWFVCCCHSGISVQVTRNIPPTLTPFTTTLVREKKHSFIIVRWRLIGWTQNRKQSIQVVVN